MKITPNMKIKYFKLITNLINALYLNSQQVHRTAQLAQAIRLHLQAIVQHHLVIR